MEIPANYRPLANFAPSIWKDTFASIPFPQTEFESYDKQVEELKEKVKEMLMASTENLAENISLIDSLCRLGVSYHFETEIEKQLNCIFESHANIADDHDYDIQTTALLFRVLRQHGFKMPCGVFNKFHDKNGMFKESLIRDIRGMLSLYEATFLSIHGEDILDEALTFTKDHLASLAANSSPHLSRHIMESLEQPLHTGIPRINAQRYISFYQHEESRNGTLLLFAKLDFNRVQLLHRKELSHLTSWWKDLDFKTTNPYSRDRLVELYLWGIAKYFEPHYSRGRLLYTKLVTFLTVIDDTYDAYGTLEELQQFTEAIDRWDINAVTQLPDYMKFLYSSLINYVEELEDEFSKEGRHYQIDLLKETYKETVRAYFVEAQWFRKGYIPSFEKKLSNAVLSATSSLDPAMTFLGMEEEITGMNAIEWKKTEPKLITATFTVLRVLADIVSHEAEQERGHVASVVECYMKEYGTSKEEAVEKLREMAANAWKETNEECMRPTRIPNKVLSAIVGGARTVEAIYKNKDGVTNPEFSKDYVNKLFIQKMMI